MSIHDIPVKFLCDKLALVVGKKYELNFYDLFLPSRDGYEEYEHMDTAYITYEGGDVAKYFLEREIAYADNRFTVMPYLGEYVYEMQDGIDSEYGHYYDLVLRCVSSKTLVRIGANRGDIETEDVACEHAAIGLIIREYNEPKFINLR